MNTITIIMGSNGQTAMWTPNGSDFGGSVTVVVGGRGNIKKLDNGKSFMVWPSNSFVTATIEQGVCCQASILRICSISVSQSAKWEAYAQAQTEAEEKAYNEILPHLIAGGVKSVPQHMWDAAEAAWKDTSRRYEAEVKLREVNTYLNDRWDEPLQEYLRDAVDMALHHADVYPRFIVS